MNKFLTFLLIALIAAFTGVAQETKEKYETVYLHSGQVVKGKITAYDPASHVIIRTDDGRVLRYDIHEVERIQRRPVPDNIAFSGDFNGKGPQRGYRAFVDGQVAIGSGKYGFSRYGVSTTHGYQFRPWLFAGAGYEYYLFKDQIDKTYSTHTIYGDLRVDILKAGTTPFIDLRVGYNTGKHMGLMVSPTIGCRFGLGKSSPYAINAAVGYTLQCVKPIYYTSNWLKDNSSYSIDNKSDNKDDVFIQVDGTQISGGFTLRLGFEF